MSHVQSVLAAPYVLEALERDESAAFETHLADCADCRHEVAALQTAVAALARCGPPVEPGPAVRGHVLAALATIPTIAPGTPSPSS